MKEDILPTYEKVSLEYGYNSNSLHKLGLDARKIEEAASNQILDTLNLKNHEVIYTSGNVESFTTILNSIDKNILTDNEEFKKIALEMNKNITDQLETKNKIFISIKDETLYKDKANHIDIDLNKTYNDLNNFDFITIESDIPFFGVLIKKKNIDLKPLINGGKSTTKYRSGTSATPLIVSFSKLIRLNYKRK